MDRPDHLGKSVVYRSRLFLDPNGPRTSAWATRRAAAAALPGLFSAHGLFALRAHRLSLLPKRGRAIGAARGRALSFAEHGLAIIAISVLTH